MSRRVALTLLGVLALAAGAAWFHFRDAAPTFEEAPPESRPEEPLEIPPSAEPTVASLYFPGGQGLLVVEQRPLDLSGTPAERVEVLVRALLEGPGVEGAEAPLTGVTLAGAFVDGEGIAYLDLRSLEGGPPPQSGSHEEMVRIWSFVNTVQANLSEVAGVVFLWNGLQPETLSGHVDLGRPLASRSDLVARDLS